MKTTKQLAKELGLLRKRKVQHGTPPSGRKKSKIDQLFSYIIVLDFESTCWEKDKTVPQEIIEFPAVLMNCASGEIESTFHHYILPSEKPQLSDFCKQLTGISQLQVENGIPLALCLRKFFYWLKKLNEEKGVVCALENHFSSSENTESLKKIKLTAFVTWSDWDLGVCLLNETRRKQVMKPSALDRWIDLRATYRKFYGRRPDGLNGAMKDLGLQFDGREHSGIDDAKNTASLAYRMMCDGCVFEITKSLKMDLSNRYDMKPHLPSSQHQTTERKGNKSIPPKHTLFPSRFGKDQSFKIMEDDPEKSVCTTVKNVVSKSCTATNGLSVRCPNTNPQRVFEKKSSISIISTPLKHSPNCHNKTKLQRLSLSCGNQDRKQPSSSLSSLSVSRTSETESNSSESFLSVSSSVSSIAEIESNSFSSSLLVSSVQSSAALPKQHFPSCSSMSFSLNNVSNQSLNTSAPVLKCSTANFKSPLSSVTHSSKSFPAASKSSSLLAAPFKSPLTSQFNSNFTKMKSNESTSSSFKTPTHPVSRSSSMKVTPPLCSCGRRSRRRLVQNPGPNEGRWFFSCTSGNRTLGGVSHSGCGFFQWEFSKSFSVRT